MISSKSVFTLEKATQSKPNGPFSDSRQLKTFFKLTKGEYVNYYTNSRSQMALIKNTSNTNSLNVEMIFLLAGVVLWWLYNVHTEFKIE